MGFVFLALILLLLLMLGLKRFLSERQFDSPLSAPAGSSPEEPTTSGEPVYLRAATPAESGGAAGSVSPSPAVPAQTQGPATTSVPAPSATAPSPEDDELEQVAVLAAAMAMAMDAELETWPGPLALPARASAVWRYQGRLNLMQGQGRPLHGWRR